MGNPIKINQLQLENVKRIKAVKIEPSENGLTVIGGDNNQGKTSVLDSIAWALGGEKYRPSEPSRRGSMIPPNLHIALSNGLIVERKGKNSDLKVTDLKGHKGGQTLLNEFIEQLALDLPKFMEASSKDKAKTLLQIIGVGEQLAELDKQEQDLYNERLYIGRTADQKLKYAKEMADYPEAPKELVSPAELIRQQQEILARNGENQRKRDNLKNIQFDIDMLTKQVDNLTEQLNKKKEQLAQSLLDLDVAKKSVSDLQDESTAELEESLANIEEINRKVRANLDKDKAMEDAKYYRHQYDKLTGQIADVRKRRGELLDHAPMPLPGLSVAQGELIYNGQKWDNMSGSDQLKVSTAIVRRINPKCGFVLLDKLEQMDLKTMQEFGTWLEAEGLQAIATRVSTGDECSIIIEDGYVKGEETITVSEEAASPEKKKWSTDF